MPALVASIHIFRALRQERRGWSGRAGHDGSWIRTKSQPVWIWLSGFAARGFLHRCDDSLYAAWSKRGRPENLADTIRDHRKLTHRYFDFYPITAILKTILDLILVAQRHRHTSVLESVN
jgi:hypothetical protein